MRRTLLFRAALRCLMGAAVMVLLIFWPAGTLGWWRGWLLMAVLFVPMLFLGILLLVKAPERLEKRLSAKEEQGAQRLVVTISALLFSAVFVVSGLGERFGWFRLPGWVSAVAALVFLIAYALYAEVIRENAYLSRTVEVQEGQTVVDTGLYGIVRHPMYAVTVPLFLSMPLILGSLWGFLLFLAYPAVLVLRIKNEEELLMQELEGYRDYRERVRYRMIPFVW